MFKTQRGSEKKLNLKIHHVPSLGKERSNGALSSTSVESELKGAPVHNVLNDAWILLRVRSSREPARCARRYGIRGSGSNSGANV
jgi:hypothetical protein